MNTSKSSRAEGDVSPEGKAFAFTSAERGYIARLTDVAANAQAQLGIVNSEMSLVLAEARQRLGLAEDARLIPDLKRGAFVLLEDQPVERGADRGEVVDLPRHAPTP